MEITANQNRMDEIMENVNGYINGLQLSETKKDRLRGYAKSIYVNALAQGNREVLALLEVKRAEAEANYDADKWESEDIIEFGANEYSGGRMHAFDEAIKIVENKPHCALCELYPRKISKELK